MKFYRVGETMKKLMLVLVLLLPTVGQAIYTGSGYTDSDAATYQFITTSVVCNSVNPGPECIDYYTTLLDRARVTLTEEGAANGGSFDFIHDAYHGRPIERSSSGVAELIAPFPINDYTPMHVALTFTPGMVSGEFLDLTLYEGFRLVGTDGIWSGHADADGPFMSGGTGTGYHQIAGYWQLVRSVSEPASSALLILALGFAWLRVAMALRSSMGMFPVKHRVNVTNLAHL